MKFTREEKLAMSLEIQERRETAMPGIGFEAGVFAMLLSAGGLGAIAVNDGPPTLKEGVALGLMFVAGAACTLLKVGGSKKLERGETFTIAPLQLAMMCNADRHSMVKKHLGQHIAETYSPSF